jgi:hypothetical protein
MRVLPVRALHLMRHPEIKFVCGRVRFSTDESGLKLVFSIPPHRPCRMPRRSGTPRPTDLLAVVRYDRQACERSLEGLIPHRAKDINVRFVNSRPEPGIKNRGSAMPSSAAAASGSWPSGVMPSTTRGR